MIKSFISRQDKYLNWKYLSTQNQNYLHGANKEVNMNNRIYFRYERNIFWYNRNVVLLRYKNNFTPPNNLNISVISVISWILEDNCDCKNRKKIDCETFEVIKFL